MAGFLRNFYSVATLSNRSASTVAALAARKAIELAMLNLRAESQSILTILAQHSDFTGPLITRVPAEAQFLYELTDYVPVGVERTDKDGLESLEAELAKKLAHLPPEVDVIGGGAKDFQMLKDWTEELEKERSKVPCWLDATTGYSAMRLSAGLTGLLKLALCLDKLSEADEIMARIADRIHANQQSEYLALIRPAWGRYFLSGWLRERLGVDENELSGYAEFVRKTTRKRLEEGVLRPSEVFKDSSMKEMLDELNRNTLGAAGFKEYFQDLCYEDSDDEGNEQGNAGEASETGTSKSFPYSPPSSILHKPATPEEIAEAETRVGRPLPDDLKEFYSLTNGTRPVIQGPWPLIFQLRFPSVQYLFWEEGDYMTDYTFDLLAGASPNTSIDWPGIEGGGIAMYEADGQGTEYLWYVTEELVQKARKVLDDAYQNAEQAEKQALDELVGVHHGGWDRLKNLKACWYQQLWGMPVDQVVYYDFKEFLSAVVLQSRVEEDTSPLRATEEHS